MKYEVYTIVHARVIVEATGETEAMGKAEGYAIAAIDAGDTRSAITTVRAASREADEVPGEPDRAAP